MKGLAVSNGLGLGKAFLYKEAEINVSKKNIESIEKEIKRFDKVLEEAKSQIDNLYNISCKSFGEKDSMIFLAHKMILEDPEFIGDIKNRIGMEEVNAEWAVYEATNKFAALFENIENEYLKARVKDLRDVSKRILRILLQIPPIDLLSIDKDSIVIGKELLASDIASMNRDTVKGIVTELGGKTSHAFIIARTLDIPVISGVVDALSIIKSDDFLIIDGGSGEIILNPNQEERSLYIEKQKQNKEHKIRLRDMIGKESISKNGQKVEVMGNISSLRDIEEVLQNDGDGVGLFRTEFIYMDRDKPPGEEEQFKIYKAMAEKLQGKSITIRTLDAGGDKEIPYLDLPKGRNPFLGYRGIRISLDRLDIFETQIRAILRASIYGNIKIILPMISSIEELRKSKYIIEEVKGELESENITFKKDLRIGIMVEIPAVAIHSQAFAKEVDFFSIGTNDLIQYTLAVDRGNHNISKLYTQYDPGVLRLIKMTIDNGHKAGISVGLCGEIAGDYKSIPLLLAMGLDEFSVAPSYILESRYLIRNTSTVEGEKSLEEILRLPTAEDVEKYLYKL